MARPVLGYPSMSAAIVGLREQGWTHAQLATALDIPLPQLKMLEKQAEKAKRRADLIAELRPRLAPHAIARGVSVDELSLRLLRTITIDGLVDAVLDDQGTVDA